MNTASFPESIYNHAKLYNVEITNATPSHMMVNLVVKRYDLLHSPMLTEVVDDQYIETSTVKTYQLIISKSYQFTVGKYSFLLPYDVQILIKEASANSDEYTITARYLSEDGDFPFIDINSPEIKVYQDLSQAEQYVYFQLDIYQMQRTTQEFTVASEDITDNLFYTASFPNQLAAFNVYYQYNGVTYNLKKYFNNTYSPIDRDEKYCYYTYVDEDKVQISFSSVTNSFRPRYNSKIIIEVFNSFGQEGNFTYNDEILFNFTENATSSYNKMLTKVYPLTSASGGLDKLSVSQEKQKIIQRVLGRDNLIMDSDLDAYFELVNNTDAVNDSQLKFIKKRDDILQRLYSAFLLMRDNNRKAIPTNTAKWSIIRKGFFNDSNNTYNQEMIIPEHSVFIYNEETDRYEFYEAGMDDNLKRQLKDKNNLIYVNPFLTKIDTTPTLKASYFKLDINQDFNTNYTYLNNLVSKSILINKININKSTNFEDDLNSDTYVISFNLNSNANINDLDEIIKIRGKLISKNTNKDYGYFEFRRGDPTSSGYDQSKYFAYISTDRKFKDNQLSLADSLYDSNGLPIEDQFIETDLILKIGVLIKDSTIKNRLDNTEVKLFSDQFPVNHDDPQEIGDYSLAMSVATIDTVRLYENLSNIMTSIVTRIADVDSPWNSGDNTIGVGLNDQISKNGDSWVVFNDEIHQVDGKGNFDNKDGNRHFHVIGSDVYEYLDAIIPTDATIEEKIWDYMRSQGLNKYATSAIMSLIKNISGDNPKYSKNGAFGLLAWADRYDNYLGATVNSLSALKEYASQNSLDVNDSVTQLAFLYRELTTDETVSDFVNNPVLWTAFKEAKTEKEAITLLYDNYYSSKNLINVNHKADFDKITTDATTADAAIRAKTNFSVNNKIKDLVLPAKMDTKRTIWDTLKKFGISNTLSSVIIAAIQVVSDYTTTDLVDVSVTDPYKNNNPFGLLGWGNGSGGNFRKQLGDFAKGKNKAATDLGVQLEFLYNSMTDRSTDYAADIASDTDVLDKMLTSTDVATVTDLFYKHVVGSYKGNLDNEGEDISNIQGVANTVISFFPTKGVNSGDDAAIAIFNYFAYYGFTRQAINAIINNIYANSRLTTGEQVSPSTTDSGYGLFYWKNGYYPDAGKKINMKKKYQAYAAGIGSRESDIYTQLEFAYDEMTNDSDMSVFADQSRLDSFRKSTDLNSCITTFKNGFKENSNVSLDIIKRKITDIINKDEVQSFTDMLTGTNSYSKEFDMYGIPQKRLFKMININSLDYDHDFINDDNNMRINGVLAVVPDGVYVVRSDLEFTTVNGKHYVVYNNKKHQGLHLIYDDGGIHKVLHDGSIDEVAINDDIIKADAKTYVMFYDALYKVDNQDGKFVDRRGVTYQITGSGLYTIQNNRRYQVVSAMHVDRSRNWYDDEISELRPKGLFVVMHDRIYQTDDYGLFVGYKKYHYRVIMSGSYQGIYCITQNESIFKLDMLGLMVASKNYKYDKSMPALTNIWNGTQPTDPNKPVFPFPNMNDYNNGTVDEYNAINNVINKTGYTLSDMLNDGLFTDFIPDEQKDFKIELIPLVSLSYFAYGYDYIYQVLESYISILESVVNRLENSTTIDLKFYNTFGPSSYWYLSKDVDMKDNEVIPKYISRTNFIYDFTIHLFNTVTDDIDNSIKQFISDFVEASNSDDVIPVSNLMRLLEQHFEIIRYIEFNGLAGKYEEKIVNKYQMIQNKAADLLDMSIDEIHEFVPEYMNVKKELKNNVVTTTDANGNKTTVTLEHKDYDFVVNVSYSMD